MTASCSGPSAWCSYGIALGAHAVLVLGIDEAAADTGLHVDEVELDDTGDGSPVLLVEVGAGALLGGQLQIDTRGQGHLVVAVAVVALALVLNAFFQS